MEITKQSIKDITIKTLLSNDNIKLQVEKIEDKILNAAKSGLTYVVVTFDDYLFSYYHIMNIFNLKGYDVTSDFQRGFLMIGWGN